ncbi:hypothetical protein [Oryzihumus sp.]|uniref:hypothetical protein n=1 Tax=Oryzihumus sp. TaxID=1968903 RepID=UPI002EDAB7DE
MYARTTIIQGDPARIDAGIAHVRDQIFPAVTAMTGGAGMSLLVQRANGRCIATTAWESEAALKASAEPVRALRASAEQVFGAGTSVVDAWEVAAMHRDHPTGEGACAVVTWLRADPSNTDRAIDVYKMAVLPKYEELDGFCSASMLINRQTGRRVGTIIFDSSQALAAGRDAIARIREAGVQESGSTVEDVAEMELAFAHLHVPEMA